jgi:hypothetical protein
VTYAGFSGESELLEELHKRGLAQPSVGPDLHAGDRKAQKVRLVAHKVFQPSPDDPLDFENTIEEAIRDLHKRSPIRIDLHHGLTPLTAVFASEL